jgi:hypothetical protein
MQILRTHSKEPEKIHQATVRAIGQNHFIMAQPEHQTTFIECNKRR